MGFKITPVAIIFETLLPLNFVNADAVTGIRIGADVKITQHPIEIGSDIADHAQIMNQRIGFTVHKTLTPFLDIATPLQLDIAIRTIEGMRGKLLTVVLPKAGTFINMLLEHFDYPVDNRGKLELNLTFRQVNIADAIAVPIPARAPVPAVQVGMPTPIDAGAQATATAAPAANVSVAATLLDAARGLVGG